LAKSPSVGKPPMRRQADDEGPPTGETRQRIAWVSRETWPIDDLQPAAKLAGHRRGAILGLVGAGLSLLSAGARSGPGPELLAIGLPTLIAATLAGWLVGPRAVGARTGRESLGAVVRMAAAVDVIGALAITIVIVVVVLSDGVVGATGDPIGDVTLVVSMLFGAPGVAMVGLLFVAPFVLVPLLIPATLWFGILRWWTRDLRS
jgi:hypothetical protein